MKVGLIGARGRMGKAVAEEISRHKGWECLEGFSEKADVIVDFSAPSAVSDYLGLAAECQIPVVIGTTGLSDEQREKIGEASQLTAVFYSSNFSKGIFFLGQIGEMLAKRDVKNIYLSETHHTSKRDRPSGTALQLAEKLGSGIQIQSFRKKDTVGIHSLTFEWEGEEITLEHRTLSRRVFAKGALEAALWLKDKPAGYYTMEDLLCIPSI